MVAPIGTDAVPYGIIGAADMPAVYAIGAADIGTDTVLYCMVLLGARGRIEERHECHAPARVLDGTHPRMGLVRLLANTYTRGSHAPSLHPRTSWALSWAWSCAKGMRSWSKDGLHSSCV